MHFRAQMEREMVEQKTSKNMHYPPETYIRTWSNHEVSGVQNWQDLENFDCPVNYKNDYEVEAGFNVTKSFVVDLYLNQLEQLVDYGSQRNLQITHKITNGSLKADTPTILERFRFAGGASSVHLFLRAILA